MESSSTPRVGSLFQTLRFYFAVICLCVLSAYSYACPYSCVCQNKSVTCVNFTEIQLPFNVCESTQNLSLKGHNLTILTERSFSANRTDMDLRALSLQHNNIQVIKSCAFCGLPRLRTLDLSNNYLIIVSSDAFYNLGELRNLYLNSTLNVSGAEQLPSALSTDSLRNLERLDLAGNHLKTIPLFGFGNLNLSTLVLTNNSFETLDNTNITNLNNHKEIRVYLSTNPFECDCILQTFYDWLKNDIQCADASGVLCAQPDNLKGKIVGKLGKEQLVCANKDLAAVSYVFLGIVLALIGVVFLMVLYLNRRGIKRWLNNIREACRDQMEVYHYRYEQDSDPRLANVAV
ncbi:trophoblast glycoprotein-like [Paramisgurnus dabryanus]|uniref:trophoblast glycoprotein-like n=1 Tax=Paramisgurnus dabryanus TaxID=90735 RepID=UPI0031F40108